MIIWFSLVSFFLDGILSRYISSDSLFIPLFTVVSLVIIYPYFNNNNHRYYRYIAILGLLYDIVYMNMLFYNFFVFMLLGAINVFIQYLLSNRLYTNIIITFIIIIAYRIMNWIYANTGGYVSLKELIISIYSSLIINIIYCIILYSLSEYFSRKYKIVKSK